MASSGWKTFQLGDLIQIKHGFAFKGEYFCDEPTHDVLLTPGNFAVGGGFKDDKLKYYRGPVPEEYVLGAGDLIVTMTDLSKAADTLGYPAIVPDNTVGHRYLHNQRLGLISITKPNELEAGFLYYLMCTRPYRHHVLAGATGTTVKHTSPTKIREHVAEIPPLLIQRRIAHILGTLDDKIELNRRMNRTLEQMASAVFKSWFIDFDPVRAKAEGRDPGLPPEIADLFPDSFENSELGEIPTGWRILGLPDVIDFLEGPGIRNWQYTNTEEGTRFINIRCIQNRDLVVKSANRVHDEEAYGKYKHFLLDEGDIVVSTSGTLGRFAFVRSEHLPLMLNTSVIRMRPQPDVCSREFLLGYVESDLFQTELEMRACGSVQRNFGPTHLRQITLLVPPTQIIHAHSTLVGPLVNRFLDNLAQNTRLAALRDTLLPRLLSGEIEVPATERIV